MKPQTISNAGSCRIPAFSGKLSAGRNDGAFVYRLGREVLNLERGVQLPYALPRSEIGKSERAAFTYFFVLCLLVKFRRNRLHELPGLLNQGHEGPGEERAFSRIQRLRLGACKGRGIFGQTHLEVPRGHPLATDTCDLLLYIRRARLDVDDCRFENLPPCLEAGRALIGRCLDSSPGKQRTARTFSIQ